MSISVGVRLVFHDYRTGDRVRFKELDDDNAVRERLGYVIDYDAAYVTIVIGYRLVDGDRQMVTRRKHCGDIDLDTVKGKRS